MPDIISTIKTFEDLLRAIEEKGLKINTSKSGTVLLEEESLKAVFLAPIVPKDDINNMSAVLRLTYGDSSFLFMGDAEKESELEMLNADVGLQADVIKIGHHGSKTSSADSFIKAVAPKYAIISCGKDNSYGHPSPDVINTLNENGVKIYRTDEVGTIIFRSDGKNITLDKIRAEIQQNAPPKQAHASEGVNNQPSEEVYVMIVDTPGSKAYAYHAIGGCRYSNMSKVTLDYAVGEKNRKPCKKCNPTK